MKKDLKNVVVSFGAVIAVLGAGSYVYHEREKSTASVSAGMITQIENRDVVVIPENTEPVVPEPLEIPPATVTEIQTPPPVTPTYTKTVTATPPPPPAVVAVPTTTTKVVAEPVPTTTVKPSRTSRAS